MRLAACAVTVLALFCTGADAQSAPASVVAVAPAELDELGRWVAKFRVAPKSGHTIVLFDDDGFVALADVTQAKVEAETVERDAPCRRPLRPGVVQRTRDVTPVRVGEHVAVVLNPRAPLRPLPTTRDDHGPLAALEVDGDPRRLEGARTEGAIFAVEGINGVDIDLFGDGSAHLRSTAVASCSLPKTTRGWWAQCERLIVKMRGHREREVYFNQILGCG